MKLWVDDVRPAPDGYVWCKSVNEAKRAILDFEAYLYGGLDEMDFDYLDYYVDGEENILNIDHDAGDYAYDGGDYIKLLDWLEYTGRNYPIRIHSMNVVGVANMRAIIQKNGWKEVF